MKRFQTLASYTLLTAALCACGGQSSQTSSSSKNYNIVDTEQSKCFNNTEEIAAPKLGEAFYGQDAQHAGNKASYTDNGDGTITDNVTGLIWQKGYEVMSYPEALEAIKTFELAGYTDWRIPTIKEAYSLILFSGADVSGGSSASGGINGTPFIDTTYFDFVYGANGNRPIDTQMLTSNRYVGSTENENLLFGVNFADGRIKGYGLKFGNGDKPFVARFVRGAQYGENEFVDNNNGTISDNATSLMWSKEDSKESMNWEDALAYAQKMNQSNYLGYSDWRVPNAKELQSIVDYSRSPLTTQSAAIDPMFDCTVIKDEAGEDDYAFYWSSTTHENSASQNGGSAGAYVAFGRSLGNMSNSEGIGTMGGGMMPQGGEGVQRGEGGQRSEGKRAEGGQRGQRPEGERAEGGQRGQRPEGERAEGGQRGQRPEGERAEGGQRGQRPEGERAEGGQRGQQALQMQQGTQSSSSKTPNWVDIHGAGSQRSDPKSGDPSVYANGNGPQGDAIRIFNFVRLVRDLK